MTQLNQILRGPTATTTKEKCYSRRMKSQQNKIRNSQQNKTLQQNKELRQKSENSQQKKKSHNSVNLLCVPCILSDL